MPSDNLAQLTRQGHGFAVYPEVRIQEEPGSKKSVQHLLFGDYITPPRKTSGNGYQQWKGPNVEELNGKTWLRVRSRQDEGWIKLEDIQLERILEVNFVDVGQGDGCHLVTPTDEHFIIDAGESDNMYRFLRWRFNLSASEVKLPKFTAIISHPDEDHFGGFKQLFDPPGSIKRKIKFEQLYHNGIVQRAGSVLGQTDTVNGITYLLEVIESDKAFKNHLRMDVKKSNYEKLLVSALKNQNLKFEFAQATDAIPQMLFNNGNLSIKILAPVPEKVDGKTALRWFDSTDGIGKTKNGHSVVLMATMGNMRILLGGDLNTPSADYLMEQYSGIPVGTLRKELKTSSGDETRLIQEQLRQAIEKCKTTFSAVVAKSCHHGSHDITNEFLLSVNPIATIISSGDEEPHCHPRPETLGAIGKCSRGERPLVYSTELSRSSPEFLQIIKDELTTDRKKQRLVSTYGMITLRTDGEKAVIAQKKEKDSFSFGKLVKWQVNKLEWNEDNEDFEVI